MHNHAWNHSQRLQNAEAAKLTEPRWAVTLRRLLNLSALSMLRMTATAR